MRFALRVVETSGLSPEATFLPKSLHPNHLSGGAPRTGAERSAGRFAAGVSAGLPSHTPGTGPPAPRRRPNRCKSNTHASARFTGAHTTVTRALVSADLELAYAEAHEAMCAAMGGLLDKTCLQPRDVDILVTTCSIYCPTPSLASMLINRFKLRSDVQASPALRRLRLG